MSEGIELERLEIFVTKLLEEFDGLRQTNEQLENELSEKRVVIAELNDQVTMQQLEREEVSQRVTSIVSQFESWERELVEVVETEQGSEEEVADSENQNHDTESFNDGSSFNG